VAPGYVPDVTTASDLITERLLAWGVGTCFGMCGDQVNGLFEECGCGPTGARTAFFGQ
jgi:hypothetical protein